MGGMRGLGKGSMVRSRGSISLVSISAKPMYWITPRDTTYEGRKRGVNEVVRGQCIVRLDKMGRFWHMEE